MSVRTKVIRWSVVAILLIACGCGGPPVGRPAVFAVLADVQYADKPTGGKRHYRTSLTKLSECVVAWFAGHDHAGGYAVRKGVHHVTLKGIVEEPVKNAYALIELHPDRIRKIGFGAEPNRDMPIGPSEEK
jgi:hypothetical protein